MQSHFTIISANIRPEIDEKISIGLLLVCGERVFFNFSKDKLNVTKELLNPTAHKYVKDTIKQISTEVIRQNKRHKTLFENNEAAVLNSVFEFTYMNYLAKYSNAVLHFSEPKRIDKQADESLIQFLYKKYIDESVMKLEINKPNKFETLKTKFYSKVQNQFNIEREFSSNDIPNLIVPLKIDMIGKNKKVVYAQSVDLERNSYYHIQMDIGTIYTLNQIYEGKAVSYIISSEPNKNDYPKQHQTWQNIRKNSFAKYIDVSAVDELKEYADKHDVKPLIATEQSN